jgi:hypothetical protein
VELKIKNGELKIGGEGKEKWDIRLTMPNKH